MTSRRVHEEAVASPAVRAGAVAAAAGPALAPAVPVAAPRRRRLWELPTQAHELLLALGYTPEALRAEVSRVLARMHGAPCRLRGREADVLYSAVHDLGQRNALAEAVQRRLDERHAAALGRWAALRGGDALRAAWRVACGTAGAAAGEGADRAAGVRVDAGAGAGAVAGIDADPSPAPPASRDGLVGDLWALLTHPQGAELEAEALYDARTWVFAQARQGLAGRDAEATATQRAARAEQALEAARQRALTQGREIEPTLGRLRDELAQGAGEAARWRARAEAAEVRLQALAVALAPAKAGTSPTTAAATSTADAKESPLASAPASAPTRDDVPAMPAMPAVPTGPAAAAALRPPAAPTATATGSSNPPSNPPSTAPPIDARRILCVGGIRHAVAQYRRRVERLGAAFEHHDGGIEDGLAGLDGRLRRADLVICQAGCINHEAYHRIKRHCERTGTPCLYLERPSLAHFDRALSGWAPAGSGSAA